MKEAIRRKGVEKREVAMSEPTAKRRKRGDSGGSGRRGVGRFEREFPFFLVFI